MPRSLRPVSQRGFTMIELLVVVAFIGILAAVGYPYFESYLQNASLKGGAQELAAIINNARELAIARNTTVCVSLSGQKPLYVTGVSNTCTGGTTFVGMNTASDGTMTLANSIRITGTTANAAFTSLGVAVQSGTYTVSNPTNGRTMSVVVSAAGRVTIQ